MNKAQRAAFLRYLEKSGATVESQRVHAASDSDLKWTVTGAGLRLAFFDSGEYVGWKWGQDTYAHALPSTGPGFDKGPRPVMAAGDKWADWIHVRVTRLTTSGAYRHTVKEETIRRQAAPLRALAASFAALQCQHAGRPAHGWTPDHVEGFAYAVDSALQDSAPPRPDSPLELGLWLSLSGVERKALQDLREAAHRAAACLRAGGQPPDEVARALDEARMKWKKLEDEEARTVDAGSQPA